MSKTVLITGSSSGIGRATALLYADKGWNVIINCNSNVAGLASLKTEIEKKGVRCLDLVRNVAQFQQVEEMFKIISNESLIPDLLINNAGIDYIGLLQDMSPEEWRRVIDCNLTSVFNCSKAVIPYYMAKHCGRIINVSSMWGNVGASCEVAYSASKGGINSFTRALGKELAPSGIAVNAVAFGAVDTRMNSFMNEEELNALTDEIPAGRLCTPDEAAMVIYRLSQMPVYVTGQILTADGGLT